MAKYHGVHIDSINIPFDAHDPSQLLENISKAITPQTKLISNLPGILGLATAIDYLNEAGIESTEQQNLSLRNRLYHSLLIETKLDIQSPPPGPMASPLLSCRLPENIDAGRFSSLFLETHKISFRPVHKKWFNGIRFSLHVFNTVEEVDKLVQLIKRELGS